MTSTVVWVNPTAGGGRAMRLWRRLSTSTPELEDAQVIATPNVDEGRRQLEECLEKGAERLLAVGGDGTAHLLVNLLIKTGFADRVAFGLVPAGTGSDLARSLGLPKRPEDALQRALTAAPRSIDALCFTTERGERRYVVNTASAGLSGAVVPRVNGNPNRGSLTYMTSTLAALWSYRPMPCRIEVDGEPFSDDPFFLVAMVNGKYFGKGMKVAPEAQLDDGWIDVVHIPPVPLWQLPYRLPQFLSGRHIRLPIVRSRRAKRVQLDPPPGFPPFEVDGECLPAGPAELRVLPGALRIAA